MPTSKNNNTIENTQPALSHSYCGQVGLLGRTNVGKSTLLNNLLQRKLSITSSKPQTTRHRILGIKTRQNYQTIYVDTPGLHRQTKRKLNQRMNRHAYNTIDDVDVILFVIEALQWKEEDNWILSRIQSAKKPTLLIINKIDTVKNKEDLLPFLADLQTKYSFNALIPICARRTKRISLLEQAIENLLPLGKHRFKKTALTNCSDTFLASEIIREKLMRQLHHEVPYSLSVEIEQFHSNKNRIKLSALIWVETPGQKAILIGKAGNQLKQAGQQARLDMEKLFQAKVHLSLWVKVKKGWPDSEKALTQLT